MQLQEYAQRFILCNANRITPLVDAKFLASPELGFPVKVLFPRSTLKNPDVVNRRARNQKVVGRGHHHEEVELFNWNYPVFELGTLGNIPSFTQIRESYVDQGTVPCQPESLPLPTTPHAAYSKTHTQINVSVRIDGFRSVQRPQSKVSSAPIRIHSRCTRVEHRYLQRRSVVFDLIRPNARRLSKNHFINFLVKKFVVQITNSKRRSGWDRNLEARKRLKADLYMETYVPKIIAAAENAR